MSTRDVAGAGAKPVIARIRNAFCLDRTELLGTVPRAIVELAVASFDDVFAQLLRISTYAVAAARTCGGATWGITHYSSTRAFDMNKGSRTVKTRPVGPSR
ncbi:hypothetical protein NL676_038223 [Syzygium grande]|nr:hypothetical protein NL676_038223 [Syzygium grande]